MLTDRQQMLLKVVVDNYVRTAEPVGSQSLVEAGSFDLSAATLRNELRALEEAGYLTHPHTSAGRIPTEAGYTIYIASLMSSVALTDKNRHGIDAVLGAEHDRTRQIKAAARHMAGDLGLAVIAIFGGESLYYTGISQLFAQPEFRDYAKALNISSLFDQVEDRVDEIYAAAERERGICHGEHNPLGKICGSVIRKSGQDVVMLLGPMRMDYARAEAMMDYVFAQINE